MTLEFDAVTIEWRGPAPFLFAPVPPERCADIRAIAPRASYGWGVVPVTLRVGQTTCTTSLFPRDGIYLVPIKVAVQRAEGVALGDLVRIRLEIVVP
ncbi:MAG: DUF1905 domain-containing protein [Fimbriimonadaceae bacterium]|nr:DUF1905 domain-containing protein [Fimbriimonadaceae bacterium]